MIDRWRRDYKHHRIHSSLDYQTHAAYAAGRVLPASPQPPEHNQITSPESITQPRMNTAGGGVTTTWRRRVSCDYSLLVDLILSINTLCNAAAKIGCVASYKISSRLVAAFMIIELQSRF